VSTISQGAVAALAVWIGKTRLIDNMILKESKIRNSKSEARNKFK
jgi:hypothetical protein